MYPIIIIVIIIIIIIIIITIIVIIIVIIIIIIIIIIKLNSVFDNGLTTLVGGATKAGPRKCSYKNVF